MHEEQLIDAFASKLKVAIRSEDNSHRLRELESKLPVRLPPSFESLLSRYSFASFDASEFRSSAGGLRRRNCLKLHRLEKAFCPNFSCQQDISKLGDPTRAASTRFVLT